MKTTTQLTSIALLTALSCSVASAALVTTTTYTGSGALIDVDYDTTNSATRGTILTVNSDSWDTGLPSYLNPGLFDGTVGSGTADPSSVGVWYGVAVRQTGGTLSRSSFTMRGGVKTAGVSAGFSILEIDDTSNTAFGKKNLDISGIHTMWNQNPGDNTLSVLNGWAHVGALNATSTGGNFVNIGDGKLDVGYFHSAKLTVNMLAGGTGQFNLADMADVGSQGAQADLSNMVLNFETGSLASFTIAEDNGESAVGAWEAKIAAGKVQVDGVAKTGTNRFVIEDAGALGTTLTLNPNPLNYYHGSGALIDVDYDTTNSATRGTILTVNSDSWDTGLPSYLNPGLFDGTVGSGTADPSSVGVWYGVAVCQTGGTLSRSSFTMRGGVKTAGVSAGFSILEIDDTSNTAFGKKNLDISGIHTMWNQNPGDNTLSVLNGWAHVGALNATSTGGNFVNIGDGKLDVGYFHSAKLTVNMLAGGTGQFNLADMADVGSQGAQADLSNMVLNFETGSLASFTIAEDNGESAVGAWEAKIAAGKVQVDGVAKTGTNRFVIEDAGALGTTLTLNPNPLNYYHGSGALIDVDYDTTNSATRGTILTVNSDSWDTGLPSYLNPGLFDGTVGSGTADPSSVGVWYGVAVCQTGGTLSRSSFTMRGGVKTAGVSAGFSILEIDDTSNTAFGKKNLDISGIHTMWNQNPGDNTLSVLNGWAHVGALAATSTGGNFVNIGNGKLDVGYFWNAKLTVNMLAGGTGQFNLADMSDVGNKGAQADLSNMILNFETGSLGSMTIASNGTGSAVGAWESFVAAGRAKIDGVATTAVSNFVITQVVDAATISLLPTLMINSDDLTLGDIDGTVTAIFAADSSGNLTLGDLNGGTVNVSFGSGSSSSVVLADYVSGTILVNFEPGSEASFTISSKAGGGNSGGLWEWWINNTDRISIGGVPSNDVSDFVIVWDGGTGNTISLAPTTPAADPEITSITSLGSGNFELTLKGEPSTSYEFYSSATLDFTSGGDLVPLTGDGTDGTDVTTDVSGNATVQMSLAGSANFVRAQ